MLEVTSEAVVDALLKHLFKESIRLFQTYVHAHGGFDSLDDDEDDE